MPPVEPAVTARSNTLPLAYHSSQILLAAGLTTNVLLTIRRASRTLPPTSSTRVQEPVRRRHVAIFSVLSLLSLVSVGAFSFAWRAISYQQWAEQGSHETPGSIWSGWYGGTGEEVVGSSKNPVGWKLGDWYADTDLAREANEVAVMTPEGFWWMGQRFAGLMGAGVFMGVEGYRRNLPIASIVSFVLLSEVVSLSYALNLFFILMLFTPMPLYSSATSKRDALWTPRSVIYYAPLIFSFIYVGLAPTMMNNNSAFAPHDKVGLRTIYFAMPLFMALAIQIIPTQWGKLHSTKSSAHASLRTPFYIISLMSLPFHLYQLYISWALEVPEKKSSYYDYVFHWNSTHGEYTQMQRATIGLSRAIKVLGSHSRHPALSVISSDVILASTSLIIWAFVRSADIQGMLENSFLAPFFTSSIPSQDPTPEKHVSFPARLESDPPPASPAKKTRGRPRKNDAHPPSALTNSTNHSSSSATSLRRSTRRKHVADYESDAEETFKPSTSTSEELARAEFEQSPSEEDVVAGGEAAALGLGLSFLGGLGPLLGAVLGAEVTAN